MRRILITVKMTRGVINASSQRKALESDERSAKKPTIGNTTMTEAPVSWLLNDRIVARFCEGTRVLISSLRIGQ